MSLLDDPARGDSHGQIGMGRVLLFEDISRLRNIFTYAAGEAMTTEKSHPANVTDRCADKIIEAHKAHAADQNTPRKYKAI